MAVRQPRYSREEHARRGEEIYHRDIRPLVEAANENKVVAIDIDTGDYEIGENVLTASKALLARNPDAEIWVVRVGHRAVHHIGLQSRMEAE